MLGLRLRARLRASAAAPALALLALGNVAFSMFAIAGTILNGAGKSRAAIISAAITLALAIVGNFIAIPMVAELGRTCSRPRRR